MKCKRFDKSKSLEELEGVIWNEPTWSSHVITECHKLRKIPLSDLTPEELRLLIGQNVSLDYLIPLALELLNADPLVEGDCYCGDLLNAVLRADSHFWVKNSDLRGKASSIAASAVSKLHSLEQDERTTTEETIKCAYDIFSRAEYFAKYGRS